MEWTPFPLNLGEDERALWQQFGDSSFSRTKFAAIVLAQEALAWKHWPRNLARISIAAAREL
jgi:hypothetical protein